MKIGIRPARKGIYMQHPADKLPPGQLCILDVHSMPRVDGFRIKCVSHARSESGVSSWEGMDHVQNLFSALRIGDPQKVIPRFMNRIWLIR